MDRNELCELREQRAELMNTMEAILADAERSELGERQAQAYDRVESRFDALDSRIKAAEQENREALSADAGDGIMDADVSGRRTSRNAGPYLGEQRFADAFGIPTAEQRDAEAFSVGSLIQALAGTRELHADSAELRALTGAGAGGAIVPTAVASGLLDGVFAASTVHEAGAQAVPMPARELVLPRIDTPPVPNWHAEGVQDVPEDEPGIGSATLSAKTIAVRFSPSVELLEDCSARAADALGLVMVQAIASAIDAAALTGDGTSNSPTGLLNDAGITPTALDAPLTADSYAELLAAVFAVRKRNLKPSAAIYSEREAEVYAAMADSTGQPLRAPRIVEELPQFSTTSVPTDLGAGTNESALFVGKFDQLAIGYRPSLSIKVEQSRVRGDDLTVELVAYARADVAVLRPAAFEVVEGIQPAA